MAYFNVTTEAGKTWLINSVSDTLDALNTELAAVSFGYIDQDGKKSIGIDILKRSVIILAPSPPNPVDET